MNDPGDVGLDLAFSFDTTGSMINVINDVRQNIAGMLQRLSTGIPGIRVAVIAHGDYGDDYETEIRDFGTSTNDLVNFVKTVPMTHGGDAPECYELVLQQARTHLTWRPKGLRALVLVGDSCPHEVGSYRNKYSIDWKVELQLLKELGVIVYGVNCERDNSEADAFMKFVAGETGGLRLPLEEFRGIQDYLVGIAFREACDLVFDNSPTALTMASANTADSKRHVRSVLTGVLLDVSGSMQRSFDSQQATEAAEYTRRNQWIRSTFKVADQLVERDIAPTNVFIGGVGANEEPVVFDILTSVERVSELNAKKESLMRRKRECKDRAERVKKESEEVLRPKNEYEKRINDLLRQHTVRSAIREILDILKFNGAPRVRYWADIKTLEDNLTERNACIILDRLRTDREFRQKVVYEFLPEVCRTRSECVGAVAWLPGVNARVNDRKEKNNLKVIKECKEYIKSRLIPLTMSSVFSSTDARRVLHDCNEGKELTDDRISELVKAIEPMIFGSTPMMNALQTSQTIFGSSQYSEHFKLLFVLSDGMPTENIRLWTSVLSPDVTVVSCLITDKHIADPRHLYSSACADWDKSAKIMFHGSSTVSTQRIPRTLFIRRGWTIDTANNETRLFVQINHPDMIKEVCDVAKTCVCCQDALSDVLSVVDLDLYINRVNDGFDPKKQYKSTCYAVASAIVIHLSMLRIVGREGGYPDFFALRDKIIAKYGENRAKTAQVLREVCPEYRLVCEQVDEASALHAVTAKRPVVAILHLTKTEWDRFNQFYRQYPQGILKKEHIVEGLGTRKASEPRFGHAVVLISFDRHSLRFMNSWGDAWADGGFFRVQSADVLGMDFIDVDWGQLTDAERQAFKKQGPKLAEELFSSLKGLQTCSYRCPKCSVESLVSEFTGHTLKARCPRCAEVFNANEAAGSGDLALNLYLTSLLHCSDEANGESSHPV